ncbi:FecR domain-containing protein [Polyangium sorediatum]|uniref:FecR domain-containing protein n=1 Tax=Polyangium sorediatum TaxID=889274 RepID=A0ABT6P9X8_9BACT|nr:FecR domain-containing protein [Polyangium sorediatum]MDI1437436.1 FecR domain-containing protein [Polyangium sorediatum]
MRSVSRRRTADFVSPPLSEARITRMWSAIAGAERARLRGSESPRSEARRTMRWRAASILAAALGVVALVLGVRLRSPSSPAMAGLVIDTGAAVQEVSLPDGSILSLAAATRLHVLSATTHEVRLRLERGSVICDVVHREERRFVVAAGDVEVEDRGTRFAVDVRPEAAREVVEVRVERGAVEVRDATQTVLATLKPGQDWKSRGPEPLTVGPPLAPRGSGEPAAPSASASAASAPTSAPAPLVSARSARALSPEALFDRASAARLDGRHADAAADFERFYRRFPDDPRAGLAAYELGRIRLGSLRDPQGAAAAFEAVLERPSDPFREDAEAARVEALANLDDREACLRARDAFLARHPRSLQAGRVARLCGGP